jgi:prepilin-type processing-associated H-X9-DG protein
MDGLLMVTYWGVETPANAQWYNFSSQHPGIVNFAYGDGSVHPIKAGVAGINSAFTAPGYLLWELSGLADGFSDDTSSLQL